MCLARDFSTKILQIAIFFSLFPSETWECIHVKQINKLRYTLPSAAWEREETTMSESPLFKVISSLDF
jgi:hypothetical protein